VCAGHQALGRSADAINRRRTAMAVVTIRQLLDSGVHFGHQTRRWNPKVKRFILTERSGIHIIDLQQSLGYIDKAYEYVRETVAHGGTILFVGTKKQAQEVIAEQATRVGQPYVNQRWLGGLLTNFSTVSKRLARMKELEELDFENPPTRASRRRSSCSRSASSTSCTSRSAVSATSPRRPRRSGSSTPSASTSRSTRPRSSASP
jgi:ribosomal protein S2